MKTPSIYVENSYYNILFDWAYAATEKDEPAAKLISIFRFHYDNRYANRILVELIERAMNKNRKHLRELGDWMPYSIAYMNELLLNAHGDNQIIAARKKLIEIGFISDQVPDDIPEFYSRSHSWYRFEVKNVQYWIDRFWRPNQTQPKVYAPQVTDVRQAITTVTGQVQAETKKLEAKEVDLNAPGEMTKQINALGKFYVHIHGKNGRWEFDKERKTLVRARLKSLMTQNSELVVMSMAAQAIIGNVVSDWHQAKHPGNMLGVVSEETGNKGKVYDDIGEHIFKTAKKFSAMIQHAESAGVTEDVALDQFKLFISGKPSKYAKVEKKPAQTSGKAQSGKDLVRTETLKPYRIFAREISAFFFTNVPNKEILEMTAENASLAKLGKGLTDSGLLFEALLETGNTFGNGIISEKAQTQMQEFSTAFCSLQEYN